jgi:hypothetical protein
LSRLLQAEPSAARRAEVKRLTTSAEPRDSRPCP